MFYALKNGGTYLYSTVSGHERAPPVVMHEQMSSFRPRISSRLYSVLERSGLRATTGCLPASHTFPLFISRYDIPLFSTPDLPQRLPGSSEQGIVADLKAHEGSASAAARAERYSAHLDLHPPTTSRRRSQQRRRRASPDCHRSLD